MGARIAPNAQAEASVSAAKVADACGKLYLAEPAPGVRGRLIARRFDREMQERIGAFRRELFPIILSLQSAIRMARNKSDR